jgi:methionyl-tRNA synthetase
VQVEEGIFVLMSVLEAARIVSIMLSPMVPAVTAKVYQQVYLTCT